MRKQWLDQKGFIFLTKEDVRTWVAESRVWAPRCLHRPVLFLHLALHPLQPLCLSWSCRWTHIEAPMHEKGGGCSVDTLFPEDPTGCQPLPWAEPPHHNPAFD